MSNSNLSAVTLRLWSGPVGRRQVMGVFLIALVLRVLAVLWLNLAPKESLPAMAIFEFDARVYDTLAKNLLHGHGYQIGGDFREYTRISPLLPVFLAFLYSLWGTSVLGVGLANAALGALTAVLLFHLVRLCWTPMQQSEGSAPLDAPSAERIALWTALCFAVYPLAIFNTPYVLKENFSIFLTVAFALLWTLMLRAQAGGDARASLRWAAAAGVMAGLSVLSRFMHIGLIGLFLLGTAFWNWKLRNASSPKYSRALQDGATAAVCFLLVLSPWLVRNYNLYGQIVLSSHGPARYLYGANSPVAEPEFNGYFEGRTRPNTLPMEGPPPGTALDQERWYARSAVRNILAKPAHVLHLAAAKFVSTWRPVWANSSVRSWLLLGAPYIVMMLLAVPGLILAGRNLKGEPRTLLVLYLLIAYYVLGHLVFWGMIRERAYVEPYLMAFAAYFLYSITIRRHAQPLVASRS